MKRRNEICERQIRDLVRAHNTCQANPTLSSTRYSLCATWGNQGQIKRAGTRPSPHLVFCTTRTWALQRQTRAKKTSIISYSQRGKRGCTELCLSNDIKVDNESAPRPTIQRYRDCRSASWTSLRPLLRSVTPIALITGSTLWRPIADRLYRHNNIHEHSNVITIPSRLCCHSLPRRTEYQR